MDKLLFWFIFTAGMMQDENKMFIKEESISS